MTNISYDDLRKGFHTLGLKQGDILIVHSSLKSLGYVEGGAPCVINAISDVIGKEGTLIVPTLTGRREDCALFPPVFNVLETPAWTGIIPETVRNMPNAKRSLHPTHSVAAMGNEKAYITSGHEFSESPCDKQSPYYLNSLHNGHILLIGVDQESNTSIHSCEELAHVPYHLQSEVTESHLTGYNGQTVCVKNRLHDWEKPETDFNKLDSLYADLGIMNIEKIGDAYVRYIDAKKMFDFTIDLLKKNKMFLINTNYKKNPICIDHLQS